MLSNYIEGIRAEIEAIRAHAEYDEANARNRRLRQENPLLNDTFKSVTGTDFGEGMDRLLSTVDDLVGARFDQSLSKTGVLLDEEQRKVARLWACELKSFVHEIIADLERNGDVSLEANVMMSLMRVMSATYFLGQLDENRGFLAAQKRVRDRRAAEAKRDVQRTRRLALLPIVRTIRRDRPEYTNFQIAGEVKKSFGKRLLPESRATLAGDIKELISALEGGNI